MNPVDVSNPFANETQHKDSSTSELAPGETVTIVITLLICVLGLLGNLVVLFVVIVMKEYKKSVTHWYMLQLAIADSLFLLTLPFSVSEKLNRVWIYPEWMCKAKESILFINYYASTLFLMIMSADRYIAVCHTFSTPLQKLRKRKFSFIIAFMAWFISLLMSIPIMLYAFKIGTPPNCQCAYVFPGERQRGIHSEDYEHLLKSGFFDNVSGDFYCRSVADVVNLGNTGSGVNFLMSDDYSGDYSSSGSDETGSSTESNGDEIQTCNFDDNSQGHNALLVVNFTVMFIMPLVVMVACYGLIVNRFKDSQMRRPSVKSQQSSDNGDLNQRRKSRKKSSSQSTRDRRRVTIMCATLVGCFVICWLPYHAINLAKIATIPGDQQHCKSLVTFSTILVYLNSALNPFLYNFLGSSFLKRWKNASKSFRRTISKRESSVGLQSVHFKKRKARGSCSTSNTAIVSTKIYKISNAKDPSVCESQHSLLEVKNKDDNLQLHSFPA